MIIVHQKLIWFRKLQNFKGNNVLYLAKFQRVDEYILFFLSQKERFNSRINLKKTSNKKYRRWKGGVQVNGDQEPMVSQF